MHTSSPAFLDKIEGAALDHGMENVKCTGVRGFDKAVLKGFPMTGSQAKRDLHKKAHRDWHTVFLHTQNLSEPSHRGISVKAKWKCKCQCSSFRPYAAKRPHATIATGKFSSCKPALNKPGEILGRT